MRCIASWILIDLTIVEPLKKMFFSFFCFVLFQGSPRYLGEPQSRVIKFLMGAVMLIALVLLIWGPLLVISLINTTNEPNPPVAVNIKLTLAGYQVYNACTSLVNFRVSYIQDFELGGRERTGW